MTVLIITLLALVGLALFLAGHYVAWKCGPRWSAEQAARETAKEARK